MLEINLNHIESLSYSSQIHWAIFLNNDTYILSDFYLNSTDVFYDYGKFLTTLSL